MKAEAISNYIKMYPQLYNWLYFNVVLESPGNTAMITDSDNILDEYIDGSKRREYLFSVAMVKNYDTGTSDINMDSMKETENFISWVETNNEAKVYPDFGDTCSVENVEVLTNIPELTVDNETNIARYMISLKVNYIERRAQSD